VRKLADQAAAAIVNARERTKIKHRITQLVMLQEFNRAISASLYPDRIYHALARHATLLLSFDRMGIALVNGPELRLAYLTPEDETTPPLGTIWPFNASALDWVVTKNQPLLRHNITAGAGFFGDELMLQAGIRAAMIIPLRLKRRVLGILSIGSQQVGAYHPDDLVVAQAIANQLAVALENAHLHEELQAQFEALQQAQARLVQNEKLVAIGQFVAGVVHELNNPLTSILGLADLLQDNGSGSEISRDLEKMAAQAQRARRIVRGLMDFAHQSPLNGKPVQVNEILSAILDLLTQDFHAYHVRWSIDLASDLPLTMADPHQLQQVFINLITNAGQAMKAAHDGGHLTISSKLGSSIFCHHSAQTAPIIRIIIKDDGPGISLDVLSHIFDPFFTTKPAGEGTGLGLAICHGIISAHSGHIWAESEPGQGTIFFIELPVASIEEFSPEG